MPYGYEIGDDEEMLVEGQYEIGDEVEDLLTVGAQARRRVPPAVAASAMRNRAVIRPKQALRPRNIWMGFLPVAIGAAAQGTLPQTPQILFRPERLLWPSDTAPWFTVDQLTLGKDNQWGTGVSNVPARAFQEDAVIPVSLGLDTVAPNTQINVLATNFGAAARTARIGMQGQSVQ